MAVEMICGQCRGNLLVEQFGVVVACPHCGAHLSIPAPESSAPASSTPPATPSIPAPAPSVASQPVASEEPAPVAESAEPQPEPTQPTTNFETPTSVPTTVPEVETSAPSEIESSAVVAVETQTASFSNSETLPAASSESVAETATPVSDVSQDIAANDDVVNQETNSPPEPGSSPGGLSAIFGQATEEPAEANSETTPVVEASSEAPTETAPESSEPASPTSTTSATETPVVTAASSKEAPPDKDHVLVSRTFLLFLMSYASAVTLGFGWLLYQHNQKTSYGIESLPDVEPPKAKGGKKVSMINIPENAEMPPQHDLEIGDTQRFGNIKVSVVKVTRGPLQFTHFKTREPRAIPTAPVLKLWLKFENVSSDQEIAPLDGRLLFARVGNTLSGWKANQFVCREAQKGKPDTLRVLPYDHAFQGEWDLAGMSLSKPLAPGEAREYYIPTAENDIEKLDGDLLWRVHFRKGFSPKGYGVTTVFEVHFRSQDIKPDNV